MAKSLAPRGTLLSMLPVDLAAGLFEHARPVHLDPGQTLFLGGDPGDGCYRVDEGLVKVHVITPSGGDRILAILGPGMIVGELSILDGAARSASASAIHESKLSFVSRAAFDAIASARPEIYRYITALLTRRLRDSDEALKATSFLPLKGRAATVLLSLSDAFGEDVGSGRILIGQKVSQSDLAAMAGIARENFSRILQDWKRQSLVSRLAGYYCLEDKAALERERECVSTPWVTSKASIAFAFAAPLRPNSASPKINRRADRRCPAAAPLGPGASRRNPS
jgi:CRP/FNR family cyclic AMP-dependent transcriptional regulator